MAISVDLAQLDGTLFPAEFNVGLYDYVQLELVLNVTAPHTTQLIEGGVFKNGVRIMRFDRTAVGHHTEYWFAGHRQPLYVFDGDVIEVRVETPLEIVVRKTIRKPGSEAIYLSTPHPISIGDCRTFIPGEPVPHESVLEEVITRIRRDWPEVEYAIQSDAYNVGTIERFVEPRKPLSTLTTNIFDEPDDLSTGLNQLRPTTRKEIFDTWPRFDIGSKSRFERYFENPSSATGNSASWNYNTATGRVIQPLNTNSWNGFLSKKKYDRYEHGTTFGSSHSDDDINGLVLAHRWMNGVNYTLLFGVTPNGNQFRHWTNSASTIIILTGRSPVDPFNTSGFGGAITVSNPNDPTPGRNWASAGKRRILIERRGDHFTIKLSNWGSTTIDEKLTMEFDLNDYPEISMLKGPQSYGYFSKSQPNSYFEDIFFDGGEREDAIAYAPTGDVYTFNAVDLWTREPGLSLYDIYGAPRALVDVTTGKIYQTNEDGSFDLIPVRRYENSPAWSGGNSDVRRPWEITNPVTGSPLSFQNIGYSIIHSVVSNPDGYRHAFFSEQRLKEGEYRVFCHVDDVAEVELTGPQGISLTFSRRDSTDITIIQGGVFDVEVVCANISGLMWWSIVLVSLDTGEIYYWPDEHDWTSSEGTIHYD